MIILDLLLEKVQQCAKYNNKCKVRLTCAHSILNIGISCNFSSMQTYRLWYSLLLHIVDRLSTMVSMLFIFTQVNLKNILSLQTELIFRFTSKSEYHFESF